MSPKSKKLLAPALSLSFLAAAFTFGNQGFSWFWSETAFGVAIALAVGAATLWALLFLSLRQSPRQRI
ncbi:MAG: hypothetical protein IPP28_11470 [Xanthomonadales bacterium]|nr:hypothetical protein [Xanthomonadales bacterium]